MSELVQRGSDGIFRGQSQRDYDFRKGERLGKDDHLVFWKKPSKPAWMDDEKYASYPEEIQVREFKVNGNVYVTTFFDANKYKKNTLVKIYKMRWHVEINLKSIKSVMNMDMLSCKTPEMVKKEIGIHFLAYNFIRVMIAQACEKHIGDPNQISFKGTVQLVNEITPHFLKGYTDKNQIMYAGLLEQIVKNKIGNRPGRVEPRVVKRRRKPFPALNRPRKLEKEKLIKKINKAILKNACS